MKPSTGTTELTKAAKSAAAHAGAVPRSDGRDSDAWFTPARILEPARRVLGGFDLDPFSCAEANQNVRARRFLTASEDGLASPWVDIHGAPVRSVWMNPPFANLHRYVEALEKNLRDGSFKVALVLTNNTTETRASQRLAKASLAMLLVSGRLQFSNSDGKPQSSNTRGQVVHLVGDERYLPAFRREFAAEGVILLAG